MNNSQQNVDAQPLRSREAIQLSQLQSGVSSAAAIENREEQALINLGVEASQRWLMGRMARLTKLRSMIEAGAYEIKSGELAKAIFKNETHSFSIEVH